MKKILIWKKPFFSNIYRLYFDKKWIGELRFFVFSKKAEAVVSDKSYTLVTTGLFHTKTIITDKANQVLGEIQYSGWHRKAFIIIDNNHYTWEFKNFWCNKWQLAGENTLIQYSGQNTGSIETSSEIDIRLLTGLYIADYYFKRSVAIIIAILIPIMASRH